MPRSVVTLRKRIRNGKRFVLISVRDKYWVYIYKDANPEGMMINWKFETSKRLWTIELSEAFDEFDRLVATF